MLLTDRVVLLTGAKRVGATIATAVAERGADVALSYNRSSAEADETAAAIRKLGAQYDGTLRHHRLRADGTVRDSAYFSILAAEWPAVRAGLDARVEG